MSYVYFYIARLLRVTNGNNEVSYWHFDDGASARRESNEANAFFPRVLRCIPGSLRRYNIHVFNSDQYSCVAVPDFYNRLPI